MSIWISGSIPEVISATQTGLVNAIFADALTLRQWVRAGQSVSEALRAVGEVAPYALFVQLRGPRREDFLAEAETLRDISELAQACVPPTAEGLAAAAELSAEGHQVMVWGVCSLEQAFLCAQAEVAALAIPFATYRATYSQPPQLLLQACRTLFNHLGAGTFLMGADLQAEGDTGLALAHGADGLIVTYEQFGRLEQPTGLTDHYLQEAEQAYTEMGKGRPEAWWR
ncbi:MAG: hypothetical protein D6722_16100 [Bacteroidetes bacterium]|nr:MAG: hypothetical protein D6722_16100 [Bacteroidota bacterium]